MITSEALQTQTPETDRDTARMAPFLSTRKKAILEVLVFLFLIVPSTVLSFFVTRQGKLNFVFVSVSTILRDVALVGLILFFLWRNGEPLSVATVGVMGLIFSLLYLWTKSLVTPTVLHFLQDFIAIVVLRYLHGASPA